MGVFCKLVDEGVQLLGDDDAVREMGLAGIGVGLPFPTPSRAAICPRLSLEGLHRPGIEVAFGIHCGFFLRLGGVRSVHVVRGQCARNGAQTRHGYSVKLLVVLLRGPGVKGRIMQASLGPQSYSPRSTC